MNKKELIKHIKDLPYSEGLIVDTIKISRNGLLKLIEQLDEPEKVKVPQFVADWIEVCKEHLTTSLYTAMNPNFMKENNQSFDLISWIKKTSNQETFARAWLDGYEVEKEKKYIVTLKSSGQKLYYHTEDEDYIFSSYDGVFYSGYHTKTDLEENDMSWVFDCPGIEVEEVERCHVVKV